MGNISTRILVGNKTDRKKSVKSDSGEEKKVLFNSQKGRREQSVRHNDELASTAPNNG